MELQFNTLGHLAALTQANQKQFFHRVGVPTLHDSEVTSKALKDDSSNYLISGQGTNTCGIRSNTSKENTPSVKNEVTVKGKQRKNCFILNPAILDASMCSHKVQCKSQAYRICS